MELLLFVLIAISFAITLSLRSRVNEAEARLKQMQAELNQLRRQRPAARPAAPAETAPQASSPEPSPSAPEDDSETALPETPPLAARSSAEPAEAGAPAPPAEAALPGEAPPILPPPDGPAAPSGASAAKARAPKPRRDFESALGTRWTVWVGALALAFGGVFLVRYSIEQGYFGPLARILSGLAFALTLLSTGEYLRRRQPSPPEAEAGPTGIAAAMPSIPALVTAVGTMTAFGSVYSAYALYDLIGPGLCFLLLGGLAVATMVASALHGPWLAALGLFGAALNPLLVSSNRPDFWLLALYLVAISGASYGLAWLRRWKQIAWATLIGMALWAGIMAVSLGSREGAQPAWFFVIAQTAMIGALFAWLPFGREPRETVRLDRSAHIALAIFAGIATLLLAIDEVSTLVPVFVLIAMLLGLAFRVPAASGAALLAGGLAAATLFFWPDLPEPQTGAASAVLAMPLPAQVMSFNLTALVLGAGVAATGTFTLLRGAGLPVLAVGLPALAAIVTPIALLIVAWWRIRGFASAPEFAAIAAALAAGMTVLAIRFRNTFASLVTAVGLEAFAAGAMAALALGLTMALERGGLTVAFALASAGAAYVTSRGPIGSLRLASGLLALVVLVRVAIDPAINAGNPGAMPILNWLLFGYGVPALAFFFAARWLRRNEADWLERLMQGVALLFLALLFAFEIRHIVHGGEVLAIRSTHLEIGLQLFTAAAFASALMRVDPIDTNPVYRIASIVFAALTLPLGVLGLLLAENPLERGNPVEGGQLINSLLLGYALPAAGLLVLYLMSRRRRPWWYARPVGILGLVLGFAYVSLQTRRFFHGADVSLAGNTTSESELWAYSAVWLALGVAMLAAGIVQQARLLRLISAAFIVPTVIKVFLIDMSGLEGAWRALSFIGLGVALIGIGLVYQRYVFTPRPAEMPPPSEDGSPGERLP